MRESLLSRAHLRRAIAIGLTAMGLGTSGIAAPVGYEVLTYAASVDNWTFENAWAGYNFGYNVDPNANNHLRYGGAGGGLVCGTTPPVVCSGTYGNQSSDASGDAKSSSSSAVLITNGRGEASSWADLNTGKLGAFATGERRASSHNVIEAVVGVAKSRIGETLHFTVAGANPTTTTRVGVVFELDGNFTPGSDAAVRYWLGFGNGLAFGGQTASATPFVSSGNHSGFAPGSMYEVNDLGHVRYRGYMDIVGSSADLGLAMELWATGGYSGVADWAHTGAISLDLPANVQFTSSSGVFLNGAAAPVPEPQGWILSLTGLAALGWSLRRRRAHQ